MTSAVVLHSGGLDSSVALVFAIATGYDKVISFGVNYNQKHSKELDFARRFAERYNVERIEVTLPIGFGASTLLSGNKVPEGHYAEESMKQTVVPNRNMVMIAMAGSLAEARGFSTVMTAVHAGDHFIYPDCRPDFIKPMDKALLASTEGRVSISTPFIDLTKAQIVRTGALLGVPFELTWSCYVGGDVHCGKCGTCYERREAFELAGVPDPTEYATSRDEWEALKASKKEFDS